MRVVPLALRRDPLDVLVSLAAEPGAFYVEVRDAAHPVTLLGCAPRVELRVLGDGTVERSDGAVTARDPLAAIEQFVAARPSALPFPLGAVVGYFGYELGRFTEPVAATARAAMPLAVLRRYDPMLVYDRQRGQYGLACADAAAARAPWLGRLAEPTRAARQGPLASAPLAPAWSAARYLAAAERVLAYIAAGDVYQVNLTQPFTAPLVAPAASLFAELTRRHPVPHAAYLDLGAAQLVANSPELFLRRRGDRIETRPIKGTRPRGTGAAHDAALAAELARDPKERAEHVMIVDLERNDLGRVCVPGSVAVTAYAQVESHPTVHHLVSSVVGRLRPDVGVEALLRATFPGGSITGAPKVRAMQIIGELEEAPRGAYTGAFGLLHPDGDLDLALAIRTGVVTGGVLRYHAGGGVVADSQPARELAEAWLKTEAIRLALGERAGRELEQCSSG
jgi:para-aminobenzoate synthetase component 1